MKVAILFEFSGIVRDAFIRHGHDAVSCDLLPSERPGPHIQADVFDLNWYGDHIWYGYDLIIAHPPCTHIASSGNRWYAATLSRFAAASFIAQVWALPCDRMCIENPKGQINAYLPNMPTPQYIHPWEYGHGEKKITGLWKRNLPDLIPTNIVDGRVPRVHMAPDSKDRWKNRSRFYTGIAEAMAQQWGNLNYHERSSECTF